jgi:acyl dehydratase
MPARTIDSLDELRSKIGQEVGTSEWTQVTQPMIDTFADVTGDHQWIHSDTERAGRESPFGTTIAHGFLTLSLISHLQAQSVQLNGTHKMGINYGLNRVRFPHPVPAGSRIRTHSVLKSVDDFDGGVQITWQVTVEVEGIEKPALVAEWVTRLYA